MAGKSAFYTFLLFLLLYGCKSDKVARTFKTENVIIIVVDGPRKSETWDEPTHQYIPFQHSILEECVYFDSFYNNGHTYTVPGHTAITTGHYEWVDNTGAESPSKPSIFQHWLKSSNKDKTKAWLITSKGKLEVLANCKDPDWKNKYQPSTDCGINGSGTGSRHDSITVQRVLAVLDTYRPNLMLVNFREPDFSGHTGDTAAYLNGIQMTDQYIQLIWDYIQADSSYKDNTTLIITNDHGRHLDGVATGFNMHGDGCDGCRSISCLMYGPDLHKNKIISVAHEQIDIPATLNYLLRLPFHYDEGQIMQEAILPE